MHIESAFSLPGECEVNGRVEKYLLRGVFDRIEGYVLERLGLHHRRKGKEEIVVDFKSNPSNKELTDKSFATSVKTYYNLQAACYVQAFKDLYGRIPKVWEDKGSMLKV